LREAAEGWDTISLGERKAEFFPKGQKKEGEGERDGAEYKWNEPVVVWPWHYNI